MGREDGAIDLVDWSDSGWVGAGPEDDLDERLLAEDEPVDERQPHVMTALGPIEPAALGLTLIGAWGVPLVGPDRDPATALLHLEQLYATGVRAVVELLPASTGSHLADLGWLMARSPIHIVTSAGLRPGERDQDAETGVPVRVGLQTVPSSGHAVGGANSRRLPRFLNLDSEGAAEMALSPASESDPKGPVTVVADPLAERFRHVDNLLESEVLLALVTGDDAASMPAAAAAFKRLMDAGAGDRLALGYAGDPITVMQRMPIFLMEAGLTSVQVRQVLVENPLKSLLIRGEESETER